MKKKTKNRIGLLFLVLVLACVGFYLFSQLRQDQKIRYPIETKRPPVEQEDIVEEWEEALVGEGIEKEGSGKPVPEENPCARTERKVAGFFQYLDDQDYIRQMDLGTDTYTRFKEILRRLSANPPVPAGEGSDSEIVIRNICHFFRIVNSNDLRLIKETIENEQDTLEIDLEVFYEWLMLGNRCSDADGLRPSMEVLYKYAGFFINTTGGRAYLFRRESSLRLIITYYCILVIHEADKKGKNTYGIDISPKIPSLRREITRYPELKFHQYYIDRLNLIESYYALKRPQGL